MSHSVRPFMAAGATLALAASILVAAADATVAGQAASTPAPLTHDVRPGPGVTAERRLSHYLPALAGTPGDTTVYELGGSAPGGTAVVVGGTHGNEIAGIMAATLLVERARVARGRLLVIPHANHSAVSYTDPERPGPEWIELQTPSGGRRFKYGSRRTHPAHQGAPDPPRYRRSGWTEDLDGNESRNLDRAYPGDAAGTLTERIAAAIVRLIDEEKADIAVDLHEAGPASRLAWMIVANPKNVDIGALAVLSLESQGIEMKLEPSSETFRGLSHREWGDATKARAFLFETPNPGQVDAPAGVDVVGHPDFPLDKRVGVQIATLLAVLAAYNDDVAPPAQIELRDLPGLDEMMRKGLGAFLR